MCKLHHVAITVTEFERYVALFEKLGMKVKRTTGEAPNRQLWFDEGIQLKEAAEMQKGNDVDHIALGTENVEETVRIALENGCTQDPKGMKWIFLPNGISVELMAE